MKLRTYLVKRTIHMVITVLIVLVLLFVLYRMMPGDAAATMMMNPKMTPDQVELVRVRYGFGKWVDYPGHHTVANYELQSIGRFAVNIEASDDAGNINTLSTHFDVNAPSDFDYVAPRILEVGLTNASIGQNAEFYVIARDESAITEVVATILCPNHVVVEGELRNFTESFPMRRMDELSDEANKTYYYNGSTPTLLSLGEDGSSDFVVTFEISDIYRNRANASMQFDGISGTETSKIWGMWANIPLSAGEYAYPLVGSQLSLAANVAGGTPTFSVISPDGTSQAVTMAGMVDSYTGPFTPSSNGMLIFRTELDGLHADMPFPVNSVSALPAPVSGSDATYPILRDLRVTQLDRNNREISVPEYPFVLSNLRLLINVTAINPGGSTCSNVTANIQRPDGSTFSMPLFHPRYVKDRSIYEQFAIYMSTMLVFDFGTSYITQRPSWEVIAERIPSTLLLFGSAMIVSYLIGIALGVVVAWKRGTAVEMGAIVVTLFFYSMPIFWFALIMQWIFYSQLGWFPIAGMGGIGADGETLQGLAWFSDRLRHLFMPLVTLVVLGLAGTILLMRTSMLEVMGEDFTVTAKAKGLKERTVVYRHVARNALLPVVTSMAMAIGGIISGGVLTETIFSWYGMGSLLVEGTLQKDFPVVQGAFYIMALLTILGNMGADILYAWLDPRVQL